MAAHYKYPHSVINNYLADHLEEANLLPKMIKVTRNGRQVNYGTIVGEEMVPEMSGPNVATNNYIVFTVARDDNEHTEYEKFETIAYQIYTKGKNTGYDLKDALVDALGRRDFTTDDLMYYQLDQRGKESFHFFNVELNVIEVAGAMNNGKEAGYYLSTILVSYSYTYEMDDRGKRLNV